MKPLWTQTLLWIAAVVAAVLMALASPEHRRTNAGHMSFPAPAMRRAERTQTGFRAPARRA